MPIIFENLLRRRGNVLGIGLERCAKSSQIGEAFFFAIAVISASMRSISRSPILWISSGVMCVVVRA